VASKLEEATEKLLFSSRWVLAPIFLGLSLALVALGFKFFQEAWHVFSTLIVMDEADLVLKVLAMIDIALVGSLIIMVMFSGYENFVSTIDAKSLSSNVCADKLPSLVSTNHGHPSRTRAMKPRGHNSSPSTRRSSLASVVDAA